MGDFKVKQFSNPHKFLYGFMIRIPKMSIGIGIQEGKIKTKLPVINLKNLQLPKFKLPIKFG